MLSSESISIEGDRHINEELFGGNILAPRGELEGAGSYAEAIEALGASGLRYPGGSLTEYMFDLSNPDANELVDARTGDVKSFIGLTEFMEYAAEAGQPATIVIPTRTQLSENSDIHGDRWPDIDEDELRSFIGKVAAGEYGSAEVRAFEIGNEYWGSGEMKAVEYGRLASEMTEIINDELLKLNMDDDIDIVIQKGNNFHYSRLSEDYEGVDPHEALEDLNETYDLSLGDDAIFNNGTVNWAYVNAKLVMAGFDEEAEIAGLDGVVAHIYSRGEDAPNARSFDLEQINKTWTEEFEDLEIYVTEWNLKSTDSLDRGEDYCLFQAAELLEIMEEFVRTGVDKAHIWPLIQNTKNALSEGQEFDELTVPGEMFALMAETLPRKALIDLNQDSEDTEADVGGVSVHMFAGENELAMYVINGSAQDTIAANVDFSSFVADYESADILILGVEDDAAPGSNSSTPVVEELDPVNIQDNSIDIPLDPGEIMQIVLAGVTPTTQFTPVWEQAHESDWLLDDVENEDDIVDVPIDDAVDEPISDTADEGTEEPPVPEYDEALFPRVEPSVEDATEEEIDDIDESSSSGGFEWALGLVLLAGLGAAGFG